MDLEVSRHKADMLGIPMQAFRLFYSYSHKDESFRDELDTHLKLLQREGLISSGTTAASSAARNGPTESTRASKPPISFCCWPVQTSSRRTTATRRK